MKNTGDNKFALAVHACDRYRLLFDGFIHFFQKNWDRQIPCSLYFFTETADYAAGDFRNVKTGPGEWSDRLKRGLHAIEEEYVIYMQEDMWLTRPVSAAFFTDLFEFISLNKVLLYKLNSSEVYSTVPTSAYIQGFNVALVDKKASGYLMSHQAAVWDREFLIAQLPEGEHPWRNERKGTRRLRKQNILIYHSDYFAENGKPPINKNRDIRLRSAYETVSVNAMLNENSLPFIAELLGSAIEQEREYGKLLQHNYLNKITHDGRPKPKKDDLIKKIKQGLFR